MTAGDVMTVRQCLYAPLLSQPMKWGNALAEHGWQYAKFAEMMNASKAALGSVPIHILQILRPRMTQSLHHTP